jgi:hypothetical protein
MKDAKLIELSTQVFCKINDISPHSLYTRTRERSVVESRRMIWGYLRTNTALSLTQLGDMFNRDHPTVLHSMKQHENAISISRNGIPFDAAYTEKFRAGCLQIKHKIDEIEKELVYNQYMLTYHVKKNGTYVAPVVRATSLVEAISEYEMYNVMVDEELILAKLI